MTDRRTRLAASRAYRLKGKEAPAGGIVRIAAGRADKAVEELRGAGGDGELAEAIHSARKDLKKLRSVLRLVRADLGEERFQAENGRYREAGRRLSASRDAEVKLETLAALGRRFEGELPPDALDAWRAALSGEDVGLGGGGALAAQIEGAIAAIEAGRGEIDRWSLSAGSWDLLAPGIERTYRRGRGEMKRARAHPEAEAVHDWRKRVKDLWYQLRIVREAWPPVVGAMADRAHELAELLGEHHDLALLRADLDGRRELSNREAFAAAIERRQEDLLADALDLGARVYAEKPKAFVRRLRAYWECWRPG